MFRFLLNKLRFVFYKSEIENNYQKKRDIQPPLTGKLDRNLEELCDNLGKSSDIKSREFVFGREKPVRAALVFVDGLASETIINDHIVQPLLYFSEGKVAADQVCDLDTICSTMISAATLERSSDYNELAEACLSGDAVLLVDGAEQGIIVSCKGWEKRSITEPQSESVVRGSREGFTENLRTNTSLVRRRIRNKNLIVENHKMGRRTKTNVAILYLQDIARPEIVQQVKDRLAKIETDAILEAGYLEEYLSDAPFSIFATVNYTEKPDVVAARMLEGRIAIMVDGTPFVLTAPMLFIENFQTAEDYYINPYYASLLRIIRLFAYCIALLAPAFFVALTTFHQELLPTTLLFTIAEAREGTPFPTSIEALSMIMAFEILKEAGLRLPRAVGQAVSIVGALVMGEAAVSAGLIGAPMVVVVAITAVAGFVVPTLNESTAILRFMFLILAAMMGGFGIAFGLILTMTYLVGMNSFGLPYMEPMAPLQVEGLSDTFIRAPLWIKRLRPRLLSREKRVRQRTDVPPDADPIRPASKEEE